MFRLSLFNEVCETFALIDRKLQKLYRKNMEKCQTYDIKNIKYNYGSDPSLNINWNFYANFLFFNGNLIDFTHV